MAAHEGLPNVLLLSENQDLNVLDKKIIREAGVEKIAALLAGREAAKYLAKNYQLAKNLLVVVNQKLEDMSGEQFCRIIRLHPKLTNIPILLILPTTNEGEEHLALDYGASAVLTRPYSALDMRSTLKTLVQNRSKPKNPAKPPDLAAFEAALITLDTNLNIKQHTPEDYFRVGMLCLEKKNWNSALEAFKRALVDPELKGEAELGLSAAWRGKNNPVEGDNWLIQAAETFVATAQWPTARTVYARIVNSRENARNPFFVQARKQINAGQYAQAATTLAESVGTAGLEEICEKMAMLCAQAANPQVMFAELTEAISKRPNLTSADEFLAVIKAKVGQYLEEQRLRAQEASEKRQAILSQRLRPQQVEVSEEPEPQAKKQAQTQGQAQAVKSQAQAQSKSQPQTPTDTIEFGKGGQSTTSSGKKSRPIALREEPKINPLGLSALPGDSEENLDLPLVQPLEQDTGGHHSFFGDLLHIAKMTWKLSRKKD